MVGNASAGIGTVNIFLLALSVMPVPAFFLTDIIKNKPAARLLYLTVFAGIVCSLYWDQLFR